MLVSSFVKSCFLVILLLVASCSHSEERDLSILNDKPVFAVHIEGFNLAYLVNVNGVSVYREYDHDGQVSLTVPVNHFMHPEKTAFAIDVVPPEPGDPFQKNARVKAELRVHVSGHSDHSVTIASIAFNEKYIEEGNPIKDSSSAGRFELSRTLVESADGGVKVGEVVPKESSNYEGSVLYERKLIIPNSLPLWAFFDSDDLPDYFTIPDEEYYPEMDSLLKEYQKVQSALETGDIESVMPMFSERNREVDLAFYREPGTTEDGIRKSLVDSANTDNLELTLLNNDVVHMMPEENGKLVRLLAADDKAAIGLNFIEGQGSVNYDLVFRREDGKWILTR